MGEGVEGAENVKLEVGPLGGRLHDQFRLRGGVQRRLAGDPAEDLRRCGRGDGALFHLSVQISLDHRKPPRQRDLGYVDQRHAPAVLREDMRDPVTHRPSAHDRHFAHAMLSGVVRRRATIAPAVRQSEAMMPPSGPNPPPVSQAGPLAE